MATQTEHRHEPRRNLPVMYTLLRVRLTGEHRYRWTGHIYDISLDGMRFEVDEAIEPGTEVEIRALLPGHSHMLFHASGRVVRLHDDEVVGPTRMGMSFGGFRSTLDRQRLMSYLSDLAPVARAA